MGNKSALLLAGKEHSHSAYASFGRGHRPWSPWGASSSEISPLHGSRESLLGLFPYQ